MGKTIFKVNVVDQAITFVTKPKLASGGVNENVIDFHFDSLWEGFSKTAVFYRNKDNVYHVPVSEGSATIPHEVTDESGEFFFGVFGSNSGITRTTEVLPLEVVEGAITIATVKPTDPTPDVYSQILQIANDAKNIAQGVRDEFDSGVVPALRDQNSQTPFKIWTGTMEEYAEQTPLPDGVMAVIIDESTEYLVSKTDAVTKYSGGVAEAVYRVTLNNIPVDEPIGNSGLYKSVGFSLSYPSYITVPPYSCSVYLVKTSGEFCMLQISGDFTDERSQYIKLVSDTLTDAMSVTIECRVSFRWRDG